MDDPAEYQVQLFRFLPQDRRAITVRTRGGRDHSQPELSFTRFLSADANLVTEVLFRFGFGSLFVIGANAGAGINELFDQPDRYRVSRKLEGEPNHVFAEYRGALGKVVLSLGTIVRHPSPIDH
jgi:hypothetical protein